MRLLLPVPPRFSFPRTVLSHGWCLLPPFRLGPRAAWLELVAHDAGSGALELRLEPAPGGIAVTVPGRGSAVARVAATRAARRVLALDLDLATFHRAVAMRPDLRWIARRGAGRLLRAPTAWEDLVKLVLTTNCSWTLTVRMVEALVERFGAPAPGGRKAFPTPGALASASSELLREAGRLGYRAPYVADLARRAASGSLDLEALDRDGRDSDAIRADLLRLPGVGPYVAENVLKLLGRPRGLALDSWMRAKYARLHHGGRKVKDRTIARRYAALGDWAGLALWFVLTEDWLDGDEPSSSWISS